MTVIDIKNINDFVNHPDDYYLRIDEDLKNRREVITAEKKSDWSAIRFIFNPEAYSLPTIVKKLATIKNLSSAVFINIIERIVTYNKENKDNEITIENTETIFNDIYVREQQPTKPQAGIDAQIEKIYCLQAAACDLKQLFMAYRSSRDRAAIKKFQEAFTQLATSEIINVSDTLFDGENFLHFAVKPNTTDFFLEHSQIIELLADLQVDFNQQCDAYKNTPLMWAIANAKHTVAMKLLTVAEAKKIPLQLNLLDSGRVNSSAKSALHFVLIKGYRKKDFDGNPLKYSALQLASKMIELGANVNLQDSHGNTPLHIACIRRDYETIEFLLKNGAIKTIYNHEGKNAQEMLLLGYEDASDFLRRSSAFYELQKADYDNALGHSFQLFIQNKQL